MTPSADTTWRSMTPDDLAGVMTLTARAHPDYMEDLAVFEERLKLAPDGCFSLVRDKEVLGYLISHPWQGLVSPPLNTLLMLCLIKQIAGTFMILPFPQQYGAGGLRSRLCY